MTAFPNDWIRVHGDYLFAFALLRVRNKETAEDLVQDTFVSAMKGISAFKGESSERTWLTSILKNKIIDYFRKKDVLRDASGYITSTEESFHSAFFDSQPEKKGHWNADKAPVSWENREEEIQQAEFARVLRRCLERLPERVSAVFTARYVAEEKSEKICKEMDLTPSNYWVMLHRAKVLVRECLEKNWFQ